MQDALRIDRDCSDVHQHAFLNIVNRSSIDATNASDTSGRAPSLDSKPGIKRLQTLKHQNTQEQLFVTPWFTRSFTRHKHLQHARKLAIVCVFGMLVLLALNATYAFRALMAIYIVSMLSVMWYLTFNIETVNKALITEDGEKGILTISELCRKTDTYAHKGLLVLAVGSGSLLTGIYYLCTCIVPDSASLRLNFIGSMLLLLTGIFPVSSPDADKMEREKSFNPGSTRHNRVAVYNYKGERLSWWNDSVSSTLHVTGIYSYVGFSLLASLLIERYIFCGITVAMIVCFTLCQKYYIPRLSVLFEAIVVTLIVVSHAVTGRFRLLVVYDVKRCFARRVCKCWLRPSQHLYVFAAAVFMISREGMQDGVLHGITSRWGPGNELPFDLLYPLRMLYSMVTSAV